MPARRPRSPLDQATTGRLKVSTQDESSAAPIVLPSCQCAQAVVVRRLEWELDGALDKYVVTGVSHEAPLVIQTVAPANSGQPKPVVEYGLLGDPEKDFNAGRARKRARQEPPPLQVDLVAALEELLMGGG